LRAEGLRRAFRNEASRVRIFESDNFGAAVGQSQQLMLTFDVPRGAALAKSLSGLLCQSNKFGALRVGKVTTTSTVTASELDQDRSVGRFG
jgi:hypothetical protein